MMLIVVMLLTIIPSRVLAQGSVGADKQHSATSVLLDAKISEGLTDAEYQEMYYETTILSEKISFFNEFLVDIEKRDDGKYVFRLDYGNTINEISLIQSDNEKTTIRIDDYGMNIMNIMECYRDGRTVIDGFEVSSAGETIVIEPKASSNWWTQTCPYGKPVDYSVYAGHKENSNIELTNKIEKITVSVFLYICIPKIGKIANKIYRELYDYIKEANPGAEAFSYKADLYYHKNQRSAGYIPAANMYVTRGNYEWYPEKNFQGSNLYETWYDCTRLG